MLFLHTQATAVYQAKEKLKSIEKARKGILINIFMISLYTVNNMYFNLVNWFAYLLLQHQKDNAIINN